MVQSPVPWGSDSLELGITGRLTQNLSSEVSERLVCDPGLEAAPILLTVTSVVALPLALAAVASAE